MHNIDIRTAIKEAGIFGYQVAAALGISETSFSRALARKEFSEHKKEEILNEIKKLGKRQ